MKTTKISCVTGGFMRHNLEVSFTELSQTILIIYREVFLVYIIFDLSKDAWWAVAGRANVRRIDAHLHGRKEEQDLST